MKVSSESEKIVKFAEKFLQFKIRMKSIRIKKGLDIQLKGVASSNVDAVNGTSFGIVPDDFPGMTWKTAVKPGDSVCAGDPLLKAKDCEGMTVVSPVAGVVAEVRRGERRKIEAVVVSPDNSSRIKRFEMSAGRQAIMSVLAESGLLAMMRQRPYDVVPSPDVVPRDIFVTGFDSAPLAPDLLSTDVVKWLEPGLQALSSLVSGKVWLSVRPGSQIESEYAEIVEVEGPHPAGNAGTVIAAINPVNKGETVWTLDVVTASRIGHLLTEGYVDWHCAVAITGPGVNNPHMAHAYPGIDVASLLNVCGIDKSCKMRVISGNVLTGCRVSAEDGFLRYPYRQISVIPEGDSADEFMGWASLNPSKYSVKRTFPAFLRGLSKPFDFDARIKGGRRAMILSGEYDKVFPMDIYPEYLIKAIMANDIDHMEKLGIYEVAPEDFALPEFVDTSKIELQKIVREGLDRLRKELS